MHYIVTMKSETFQHKDILRVFPDLSARSLVSYCEKGLIIPFQDAEGRGKVRIYDFGNVIEAGIIRELVKWGLTYREIRLVSAEWKQRMRDFDFQCVLVWQREMFVSEGGLPSHFTVRVFSYEEFNEYGIRCLREASSFDLNTGQIVPIGSMPALSSAMFVDVARIHRHVKNQLG